MGGTMGGTMVISWLIILVFVWHFRLDETIHVPNHNDMITLY